MNAHTPSTTIETLLYAAGMTAYATDLDRIVHRRPVETERAPDSDALPPTPYGE